MFEDFSSHEEQMNEQNESHFEPELAEIIKEIGVPADLLPEARAEAISAAILELPAQLQVPAIEIVVEDAGEVKEDAVIAKILRNIINTELGRGLEQELKDKIVDLAYEIDDVDLQKVLLVELEKAGILVRKNEGPMETKRADTTKIVIPIDVVDDDVEDVVDDEIEDVVDDEVEDVVDDEVEDVVDDEVEDVVDDTVEEVEKIELRKFDFTGEKPPEDWEFGGGAKVTGDGIIDEVGEGYLRLTENKSYDLGYAFYDQPLETANGLTFTFKYVSWGGNGADGITFFLVDGKTSADEFATGGVGGSLGYAPRYQVNEGMTNAYVGVGLDEFGNFAAPIEGRTGGPGRTSDSVTIRAGGSEFEGYEYVAGTSKLAQGIDKTGTKVRPETEVRNVTISLEKTEKQTMTLTMDMQFGEGGKTERLFENVEIPNDVPETVKFGFVATTGGSTNYHEVREVTAQEAPMEEPVVEVAEKTPEKVEPVKAAVEQPVEKVAEQTPEKVEPVKEKAEKPVENKPEQPAEQTIIRPRGQVNNG